MSDSLRNGIWGTGPRMGFGRRETSAGSGRKEMGAHGYRLAGWKLTFSSGGVNFLCEEVHSKM